MPRFRLSLCLALLAACEQFPQLDEAISDRARQSGYPDLAPVDQLLARADDSARQDQAAEIEALRIRARLLQARAQLLRRTDVIDSDSQDRMKAGFERLTQ